MKKIFIPTAIALAWFGAYLDWLQPGWLQFGWPVSMTQPLTTETTYDLAAGVRNTAKCAALEVMPGWMKPGNWRIGPRTEEPKTCTQKLKEDEGG